MYKYYRTVHKPPKSKEAVEEKLKGLKATKKKSSQNSVQSDSKDYGITNLPDSKKMPLLI